MREQIKKLLDRMGLLDWARGMKPARRAYRRTTYQLAKNYTGRKGSFVVLHTYQKGKRGSSSQYGIELFLLDKVFNGKSDGTFVEVGANDPIRLSNSFYLEQIGWQGISFEPIANLQKKWKDVRTTPCYSVLLGDKEDEADFVEIAGWGDVLSSVKGYGRGDVLASATIVKKQMRRLGSILQEQGLTDIDILFVDVEGFELNVLRGVDFDKTTIQCITVENPGDQTGEAKELRDFLVGMGYRLAAHIGGDDVFVKAD